MFYIISRPPTDNFTFKILYKVLSNINTNDDIDCFYAHSYHLEDHYYEDKITYNPNTKVKEYQELITGNINKNFLETNLRNDVILLVIKDHMSGDKKHTDDPLWLLEYVRYLLFQYPNKKFILSTSLENVEGYFNESNIKIVRHGGDIVNQHPEYKQLKPIFDKNFNSNKTSISLNRNFRFQRLILLSMIMHLGIQDNFQLSCMFKNIIKDIDIESNFKKFKYKDILISGISKLNECCFDINHNYNIYPVKENDNAQNFCNQLTHLYKNSFIEIAVETTFLEDCFLITEKTANVFLACNFPIILNSRKSIEFLRYIGFDMFDDIIDHSYDNIEDPVERVYIALKNNQHLLVNAELIKKLWIKNKNRFIKNVSVLQDKLYSFYEERFVSELKAALNEI